jgi:hypothetical protein
VLFRSGVAARVPVAGPEPAPAGTAPPGDGPRLAEIHATARDAELSFDARHAAVLKAPHAALDLRIAPADGLKFDLDLRGGAYALAFAFETKDDGAALATGAPATLSVGPAAGERPWASARFLFAADPRRLSFKDIDGVIGADPVAGAATIRLDGRAPEAALDLRLRRLVLDAPAERVAGGAQTPAATATPPDIDTAFFRDFPVTANLAIGELRAGPARAGEVKARITADERGLDVAASGRFYDGAARAHYARAPQSPALHQISLSVTEARLAPLLADLAGVAAVDGRAEAHLDIQTEGTTPRALAAGARGAADVTISDGRLSSRAIADLADAPLISDILSDRAALTAFRTFSGHFAIADGKAATNDLRFESALVSAPGRGAANLATGTVDFTFQPTLLIGGRRGGLKVPVRVFGPWKDPDVSANFESVLDNPLGAVESLGGLGAALFGDDDPEPDTGRKSNRDGDLGRKKPRR